jgi:WD40 repeat protein/DNA-binding SARP family transcriptional activator
MHVSILGPLEASVEGRPLVLGAGKPRALLAILALHAGEPLSTERLIDGLWGERPPASATKLVQLYVSQLRKALGAAGDGAAIVTRGHGYELDVAPDEVDVGRFERLVATGAPREALALWRGRPLDDVAGEPFAAPEIRRLEELRLSALEQAIDADLDAGRHREVVGELEALVAEEPLRERLQAQRMLALYRSGRQAEALDAYREARRALVGQVGIEPGPELRRLHEAILRQDPALDAPATEPAELPSELDATTLLAGRDADLDWLRELWRDARASAGGVVAVVGPRGIGKSRLAAGLAVEVHREGATVLYASCAGDPGTVLAALDRAGAARRPVLLVLDDLDRADRDVRAALAALDLTRRPALVVAAARDATAPADATLRLGPLDAAGAAAVAALYHPGEAPVEQLLEASGGVPARLHRAAREWARAAAVERLGAAAGRAAGGRAELRAAEAEVAGGVEALRAFSEDEPEVVACPFKGLASFDVDDAGVFFGRERLVAELVARVAGAPLMAIVGPSGSGKSSVLRAGLLAALAAGVLPGSERWPIALLRPGEHPLRALERASAGVDGRSVLAVDQFEELFSACRDESERAAFADALAARAGDPMRQTLVLIAVRADFYGHLAAYPELSRLAGDNHVLVGPMRRDELRRAIELPARRAGLRADPELVDALVADVADEPGALPLLSSSLLELWQRRDGRRLRLSAYEQAGGVRGAVARLAERAYERLEPERREVARRILLRLAEGEGDAVVRRRVPLAELEGAGVAETLSVLADERLVTVGEGEVEVAHEALLREWPRLRDWLEEDAEGRRVHAHLIGAARDWQAGGRDPGELYRGARLAAALDWAGAHDDELNETERAFLDAGRSRAEREAERQRRAVRRLRALLASLAALLALALVAGIAAISQRGEARDAARAADAQRLGAMALTQEDVDHTLLLARQGLALQDSPQTRSTLLAALLKSPAAIGILRGDGDRLIGLDLSPDGRTLAFMDHDGTLDFVDTGTRRPLGKAATVPGLVGNIIDAEVQPEVRFSPDGSTVAVGGGKPGVYDARTHRRLSSLQVPRDKITYALTFSPDGRELIAQIVLIPGGTRMVRFDPHSGRRLGDMRRIGERQVALMVTSDGRRIVTTTADHGTVIWDARTLAPVRRLAAGGETAALAPNGRTMIVGDENGLVRFVDLDTGMVRDAAGQQNSAVVRATFSPDGRVAVTAGQDGRMIVWDTASGEISETLAGPAGQITALAFSPDGATLYSSALDGRVFIWDLGGARRLGQPFRFGTGSPDAGVRSALSSDGAVLAAGNGDGTVTFVDARTLAATGTVRITRHGETRGIGFVPGGHLLVAGDAQGYVSLVDADRRKVTRRWRAQHRPFYNPGLSADGRVMATASRDRDATVRVWSLPSGRLLGARRYSFDYIGDIDLSPDGRLVAVAGGPRDDVEILDVPSMRRRGKLAQSETIWDVVLFTPDGRFIVGGSYKGWSRLWSAKTFQPVTRKFTAHAGRVEQASVSPDGRTLATGGPESAVRLWDLRGQTPFGAPLPALPGHGAAPVFSADGTHLFVLTDRGVGYRWDIRPAGWASYACAVAGRSLTRAEWQEALPGRAYAPAC